MNIYNFNVINEWKSAFEQNVRLAATQNPVVSGDTSVIWLCINPTGGIEWY